MSKSIKYLQVQRDLKKSFIQGSYEIGDKLPSEYELASRYNITRMTVRNALKNFEIEGLISKEQGKRSVLKRKHKSLELLSIKGFTEVMSAVYNSIETIYVKRPFATDWQDDFYWELSEKERKSGCIYMSRIRLVDGCPIMSENTFIPNQNLAGLCSTKLINDSLFDTLFIKYDVEIIDVTQKFRAMSASNELVDYLKVDKGAPILEIIRRLKTNIPNLYLYSFTYCNTEKFIIET